MALTPEQLAKLTKLSHLQSAMSRVKLVTDDLQTQIDALDDGAIKSVKVNVFAQIIFDHNIRELLIQPQHHTQVIFKFLRCGFRITDRHEMIRRNIRAVCAVQHTVQEIRSDIRLHGLAEADGV